MHTLTHTLQHICTHTHYIPTYPYSPPSPYSPTPHIPPPHNLIAKLVITTAPRHAPGSGTVLVETVRGGVGVSSITFTYVTPGLEVIKGNMSAIDSHSPFVRKRNKQQGGEMLCTLLCYSEPSLPIIDNTRKM